MRLIMGLILALSFAVPAQAEFRHYIHHHFKHVKKVPTPSSKPEQIVQSGGSNALEGVAAWGAGCFVSQLSHFIYVGITENRPRTDKEVEANMALCSVVGIPIWLYRWQDGKRVPKTMLDVIDNRHGRTTY